MSNEATTWALNLAPIPYDANGKPSAACAAVLFGLANHADPDGTGAFPAVATLVRYTRLSERTVQVSLSRLRESGVIRPCAEALVAARISRGDRRPNGYDLDMSRIRDDLTEDEMRRVAASNKLLRPIIEKWLRERSSRPDPNVSNAPNGVQQLHPVDEERGAADAATGCSQCSHGVQLTQSRGAAAAPEPSLELPIELPREGTRMRASPTADPVPGHGTRSPDALIEFPADWQPCEVSQSLLRLRRIPMPAQFVIDAFVAHWAGRWVTPRRVPNEFAKWICRQAGMNGGKVPTEAESASGKAEAESAWAEVRAANQRGQLPANGWSYAKTEGALMAIGGFGSLRDMRTDQVPFRQREFVQAFLQAAVQQRATG